MEILLRDMRYGIRMLSKRPGFTAVAIIALALGIGANTAVFSVVNTVLLRPLPFAEPDRLVNLWTTRADRGINKMVASYPDFVDWRDQSNSFEQVAAYSEQDFTLTGGDNPSRLGGMVVSSDLFPLLKAQAAVGRTFSADDDRNGAPLTAVLSHKLWKQRYNGEASVIGSSVTLNSKSYTVIGVMPEGFQFPVQSEPVELWTTFAYALTAAGEESIAEQRGAHFLHVIARLKPGVHSQTARADVEGVAARLSEKYPDTNTGMGASVNPTSEDLVGDVRPALLILMGAVGCVLLIACTNVASLLLARATTRHKEMAIRAALGASRVRVVRQLLTESLVLALAGGAIGLLIALWGTDALVAVSGDELPRAAQIGLDMRVLGFTLLVSLITGVLFGIAPAVYASKTDLNEALKEGGRAGSEGARRNRLRGALVTAEVAIAVVLLTGAGLLIQSLWRLQKVDSGIDTHNVICLEVGLPEVRYTTAQQREFYRQLQTRLSSLPGVVAASASFPLPLTNQGMTLSFETEGRPLPRGDRPSSSYRSVSLDFFRTLGMRIVKGRDFNEHDDNKGPDVIVINEAFADRYFPGEDPIGKRIKPGISVETGKSPAWREIVGIVSNTKYRGPKRDFLPEYYVPESQVPLDSMILTVKTVGDPHGIVGAVRDEVRDLDKDLPIYNIHTLDDYLSAAVAQPRLFAVLLAIFAGLALALTTIGLYGVMSYSVAQRTHEIGIRMALGARPANVLRLMVMQGMTVAALGIGFGLATALLVTRVMAGLLFGIGTRDPVTFAAIALIIAGVALGACFVPARRATKVDPMVALRYE
ncbi:MAG TPA: ABC transporter permease [Blastocatellia bacterium]|nr:ABC transporter permease [Blastocatellia bacterium]